MVKPFISNHAIEADGTMTKKNKKIRISTLNNRSSPMIRRINFLKYVEKRDNPYSYKLFKIKKRLHLKQ